MPFCPAQFIVTTHCVHCTVLFWVNKWWWWWWWGGSGNSWNICKSAPWPRQITMPVPHHSVITGGCPSCHPLPWKQTRSVLTDTAHMLLYEYAGHVHNDKLKVQQFVWGQCMFWPFCSRVDILVVEVQCRPVNSIMTSPAVDTGWTVAFIDSRSTPEVIVACWTSTYEAVHLIHTRSSIEARRRVTLVNVLFT